MYVVAATATTPLWGKLGDRHGRKRLLQISLAWFVLASAACGMAQDITQLIVLRAVQGIAAGGLMTLAMASVGDIVAPRERGRYQGYIAAAFSVATVLGPLVGGGRALDRPHGVDHPRPSHSCSSAQRAPTVHACTRLAIGIGSGLPSATA